MTLALLLACATIALPEPVVDYPFDSARGTQILDRGPLRLMGRAELQPVWIPSPWGAALRFAGESYVALPAHPRLNPVEALTIACLLRPEGEPSDHDGKVDDFGAVVGHRHGANGYLLAVHRAGRDRKVSLVINGLREPERRMVTSDAGLTPGAWHHVAATFEPTRLRVWVDGALTERAIPETAITPCPDPVVLGKEYPTSTYYRFRGAVDQLRIWDATLTAEYLDADRRALMAASKPPAADFATPAVAAPRAAPWVVAHAGPADFVGDDDATIRAAIEAAGSGDTILIKAGTYRITGTLRIDRADGLTIEGEPGTILLLDPLYHTTLKAAAVGESEVVAADEELFRPGQRLRIEAPGAAQTWRGVTRTAETVDVRVSAVDGRRLLLAEPLKYAVPEGAAIAVTDNLMEMHAGRNLTLRNLVLDANRQPDDPTFVGHVARCAFFASGPYNYEQGLRGEPLRGLRFEHCTFSNAHGRPLAWYAVHDSVLQDCTFEHSPDAGVDLDHFCANVVVQDCTITDCGVGVELNDASRCRVESNDITDCGTGLTMWEYCTLPGLNEQNVIRGNRIAKIKGVGIDVRAGGDHNRIETNRISATGTPWRDAGQDNIWVDNVETGD